MIKIYDQERVARLVEYLMAGIQRGMRSKEVGISKKGSSFEVEKVMRSSMYQKMLTKIKSSKISEP
jgi:hypothetical protein